MSCLDAVAVDWNLRDTGILHEQGQHPAGAYEGGAYRLLDLVATETARLVEARKDMAMIWAEQKRDLSFFCQYI